MISRELKELRALARRDEELNALLLDLRQHDNTISHIRARCDAIDEFFEAYTEMGTRLRAGVEKAELDLAARRAEIGDAERVAASAPAGEERDRAKMALARGRDRVGIAETKLVRAHSEHDKLEEDAANLPVELTRLEIAARALSVRVDVSAPGSGPGALAEWTPHAHATLFLAISQLTTERERITREANELASMLLGEVMYGSTAAQALRQVEAEAELTARSGP